MAWLELQQSLRGHRKVLSLADRLDIPEVYAVGHLVTFWLWCLDNSTGVEGDIPDMTPRVLARAAEWPGDPKTLLDAMLCVGFLEATATGVRVHDWYAYAGKLMMRREENASRMREKRAVHVQDTTIARAPATVPNPTVPYLTQPNPTKDEDVPPTAAPADPPRPAPSVEATPLRSEPVPGKVPEPTSEHDRKTPPTAAPPPAPSDRPSVLPIRKPSRFQDVLDAVAAAGITLHHTSRDAAAVKSCSAEPALIAEAYVAAATGDWGDAWMLSNLSLTTICQRIPAYEAWKHGVTSKQPARASPGRSGRGLSIQELARMGGST